MKKTVLLFLGISLIAISTGCKKKEGCTNPTANNYDADAEKEDNSCTFDDNLDPNAGTKAAIKETYANIVFASYQDSYNEAVKLKTSIDVFIANPSESLFSAVKQAWIAV